jgi:hypothetical protein
MDVGKQEVIACISQGHLSSVHQPRFHHGLHHLTLSHQFVPVDGMRVDVQSGTDTGMPQHELCRVDVGLGLGDQVGCQGMSEIVEADRQARCA